MNILTTPFRWVKLILVLLPMSLCHSLHAQTNATITCSLASNPSVIIQNYGGPLIGCQYHFAVTAPGYNGPLATNWSFPNAGTGIPPGVTIVSGSMSGPTIDVVYSSTANSSQPIRAAVGSGSITNQYYITTNNLSAVAIVASANPICINTPLTLSLANISGVSSVYWIGYTSSTDASNSFALQLPNGISGPTTFQVSISGGCGSNGVTLTRSITITPLTDATSQVAGERDVVTGDNQGTVTLTNYKGSIQYWQSSQDNGGTWTMLSQYAEDLFYSNLTTTTLYRAVTSLCGVTYTSTSCPIRVHAATDDLSWTETQVFANDGTLTGDSRTYVDGFGKPLQSQAKSLSAGKILASQPLYGRYDQAVATTLAAPIAETEFTYKPLFVRPFFTSTIAYNASHFDADGTLNSPNAVGTSDPNTLGWYYSTNNTIEPRTAITSFPYSRTDAIADGSSGVSRLAGPAPGLRLGSGRETVQGSFSVRKELDEYVAIRNRLLTPAAIGAQPVSLQSAAVQSLSTDADGSTALLFADKEGRPVMSARPANSAVASDAWVTTNNTAEIGWPHKLLLENYSIGPPRIQALNDIMMFDAAGQWKVTGSPDAITKYFVDNNLISTPIRNFTFYSTDAFTLIDGFGAVYTSQEREAYPFFNFYLVSNGSASLRALTNSADTKCRLFNTVTGVEIPLPNPLTTAPLTLPAGYYQVRVDQGTAQLTYSNSFKDISYSFYNQKGQLVESIAPNGVRILLDSWRSNPAAFPYSPTTSHPFSTSYEYDVQGRNIALTEPDAGRTEFIYRTDGNLRFSQNAKQRPLNYFSYINYDNIGRVIEVGEGRPSGDYFATLKTSPTIQDYVPVYGAYDHGSMVCFERNDAVRTYYEQAGNLNSSLPSGYTASFLNGRVAATAKFSRYVPCAYSIEASRTLFSYDEQGRTQWQVQQTSGQPARTIDYSYDAAGNTKSVCYQKSVPAEKGVPAERLTHYYAYDADNRLSSVSTDNNDPANSVASTRTKHAQYYYYLHGPLKRIAYGPSGTLQGVDYTYTADGKLKAINDGDLSQDPGRDGTMTYRDFFGTTINYYPNDYASAAAPNTTMFMASGDNYKPHYNGLVSGINWQTTGSPLNAYGYNYDYKGQLLQSTYGTLANYTGRQYGFSPESGKYQEGGFRYDPNGNIGLLNRYGAAVDGSGTDAMNIGYTYNLGTNKLGSVWNAANAPDATPVINYTYDAIGQMTDQVEVTDQSKTKHLDYDASGKVTAIYATGGNSSDRTRVVALYTYDEFGKRLTQKVFPVPGDQTTYTTTTFVRDIAGHELASYVAETKASIASPAFLYEQPIYGAARLGIYRQARPGDTAPAEQLYELNDQLGNTRVVFRTPTTTTYALSMEDRRVSSEKQVFPGPTPTTYDETRSPDYSYGSSSYNSESNSSTHYSTKVVAGKQGPTKTIMAQRGDKLRITAVALYNNPVQVDCFTSTPPATSVVAGGVSVSPVFIPQPTRQQAENKNKLQPSGWRGALGRLSFGVNISLSPRTVAPPKASLTGTCTVNGPAPSAQLQYVVRKVSDNSIVTNSSRVQTAPLRTSDIGAWQTLTLDIEVTESFPVYVEVSTVNAAGVPAYFDDLTIQYTISPIVEENNFYAYGQRNEGLSWRRSDERNYGRGYQGQNTTQDAESGYTAFELRNYDARIGRWLSTDPARQFASPYSTGNNPVSSIDRDGGLQEFPDDYAGNLGQGDWRESDRLNNTSVWQNANIYNLSMNAFNEYSTISQRTDFYRWYAADLGAKGFEVGWPGAASIVASQLATVDNPIVAYWVGDDVKNFANEGNRAIFNDVFDDLAALRNGPVLTGAAAAAWDSKTLRHEQFDVVQPIYLRQSLATKHELQLMASGSHTYWFGTSGYLHFKGNVLNPADRYDYGMKVVAPFYKEYFKLQSIYHKAGW